MPADHSCAYDSESSFVGKEKASDLTATQTEIATVARFLA